MLNSPLITTISPSTESMQHEGLLLVLLELILRRVRLLLLLGTSPTGSGLLLLCLLELGEEKGVGVATHSSGGSLLLGLLLLSAPSLRLLGEKKLELKLRHGIGGLLGCTTCPASGHHGLELFSRELTSGGAGIGILVGGVHDFFVGIESIRERAKRCHVTSRKQHVGNLRKGGRLVS